jgi:FKBP-type peptidyl-prolyl cis-trans isomerase FkpA
MINGLNIGLRYYGKGGKGTIFIPSSKGFGNNPPRGIRKNAVLIYRIHVLDF